MVRGNLGVLLVVLALSWGCATAPPAKAPDESRRVLVNKVVPPELGGPAKPAGEPAAGEASGVSWR